jgi:hypothetical protein
MVHCRWQLVSLILILCQGFIFEHDEEIQQRVTLFFGVTAAIMILGLLVYSIGGWIWRKFKGPETVCVSFAAFKAIETSLQKELLQVYAQDCFDKRGVVILDSADMNRLTVGQRQEVLGIVSKESVFVNSEEFGRAVETYRTRTEGLDKMMI